MCTGLGGGEAFFAPEDKEAFTMNDFVTHQLADPYCNDLATTVKTMTAAAKTATTKPAKTCAYFLAPNGLLRRHSKV